MTRAERDEAELDAVLEAASADLADEAAPRSGDEGLVGRAVEKAMAHATIDQRTAVALPLRWRRGTLLAAAALIVTSSALALIEHSHKTPSERAAANGLVAVSSPTAAPSAIPPPPVIAPSIETPSETSSAPSLESSPAPDAAELFSQANEARRHGDVPTALRRYAVLQRRFPHSPEAALSRVALGRLYLDRLRDPARALAQFDGYLSAGSDELREEALVGRAIALQRLGRTDDERDAWRALLQAYPSSLSADRAKERLGELH
jgi:TolA-binding protein